MRFIIFSAILLSCCLSFRGLFSQSVAETGFITATDVRLRSSPSLSAGVIGLMELGTPVHVLGKSSTMVKVGDEEHYWYHVELYGNFPCGKADWAAQAKSKNKTADGWVYGQFVKEGDVSTSAWLDCWKEITPLPAGLLPLTRSIFFRSDYGSGCFIGSMCFLVRPGGWVDWGESGSEQTVYALEKARSVNSNTWELTLRVAGNYDDLNMSISVPFPAEKLSLTLEVLQHFDRIRLNGEVYYNQQLNYLKKVTAGRLRIRETPDYDIYDAPAGFPMELPVAETLNQGDLVVTGYRFTEDTIIEGKKGYWVQGYHFQGNSSTDGYLFNAFLGDPTLPELAGLLKRDSLIGEPLLNGPGMIWKSTDQKSVMEVSPYYLLLEMDSTFTVFFVPYKIVSSTSSGLTTLSGNWFVRDAARGPKWIHYYSDPITIRSSPDKRSLTTSWKWSPYEWATHEEQIMKWELVPSSQEMR